MVKVRRPVKDKKESTKKTDTSFVSFPRVDQAIPDVAEALGVDRDAKRGYTHRVSNSSDCVRNLVMYARGVPADPRSGRMEIILDDSSTHEDLTCRWLDKTPIAVTNRQLPVTIASVTVKDKASIVKSNCEICGEEIGSNDIHGHIDGTVDWNDLTFLFEHKAISTFRFDRMENGEDFPADYVQQCCGYIVGLQNMGFDLTHAILVIKNKNSGTYKQFGIIYDREEDIAQVVALWTGEVITYHGVVKELIAKHIIVQRGIDDPKSPLPARPYAFDSFECQWCRRKDRCWETYPEEIVTRKESLLDSKSELAQNLRKLITFRQASREAEQQAKEIRQRVAVDMSSLNLKGGNVLFDDNTAISFGITASRKSFIDRALIPQDVVAVATKYSLVEYVNARVVGQKRERKTSNEKESTKQEASKAKPGKGKAH